MGATFGIPINEAFMALSGSPIETRVLLDDIGVRLELMFDYFADMPGDIRVAFQCSQCKIPKHRKRRWSTQESQ